MSAATAMGFARRAEGYIRASGREPDEHRLLADQVTPRQRRRMSHKERRSWRAYGDAHRYDDIAFEGGGAQDDLDDFDEPDRYCVTPGCNCCGDEVQAEIERRFLGDAGNWRPEGLRDITATRKDQP